MVEIKTGHYRHFKGNEYEVIGIARHSETEEPMELSMTEIQSSIAQKKYIAIRTD